MPNTITFKPEVITARRPRTTPPQAPKSDAPKPKAPKSEPKPQQPNPGVIDMPPMEVTPGDSKTKCDKHLGKDFCKALEGLDNVGSAASLPAKFNAALLQNSFNLNSNSSASEVFSAVSSQTW